MATRQLTRKQRRAQERATAKQTIREETTARGPAGPTWPQVLPYLAPALALGLVVFAQTLGFDFVNWDDDVNVLENRNVIFGDVRGIFTDRVIGNYNPLSTLTFAAEYALVGANAKLFHATNLALHLACVALVFLLGLRLRLAPLAAGLLAALFAIHPMRVESVAWVTERKDVLFAAFYFGALQLYERHRQRGAAGSWHFGVAGLFALALLAKIQAVSLPLSMLCLDYLRRDRLQDPRQWRALAEEAVAKTPYFLLSLAVGLAGLYFLGDNGSLDDATDYTFVERLAVGAQAYATYLAKSVWPWVMSPLYPYPKELPWVAYASFAVVAAAVAAMVVGYLRRWIAPTFALAFFTVNVVFLLQVLAAGQGYLADRFTYAGYFGLFWGFAYGWQRLLALRPARKTALLAGAGAYVLALAALAYRQTGIWRNGDTLWAHVIEHYPNTATAYGNRGLWLRDRGQTAEAETMLTQAIAADPTSGTYHNSRGKMYFDLGRDRDAIADYTAGLAKEPEHAELLVNRGAALAKLGRYPEAARDLDRGLELDPEHFNGYLNRSLMYYMQQRFPDAVADYGQMLRLRPERHDLWKERAQIRVTYGEWDEALADVEEAIRRAPDRQTRREYEQARTELLGMRPD